MAGPIKQKPKPSQRQASAALRKGGNVLYEDGSIKRQSVFAKAKPTKVRPKAPNGANPYGPARPAATARGYVPRGTKGRVVQTGKIARARWESSVTSAANRRKVNPPVAPAKSGGGLKLPSLPFGTNRKLDPSKQGYSGKPLKPR